MSRELEADEIRVMFVEWLLAQIDAASKKEGQIPLKELLTMYTFSLLNVLDSGINRKVRQQTDLPAFILAPYVSEGHKELCESVGQNYFPDNRAFSDSIKGDISGMLHEKFMSMRNQRLAEAAKNV